MHHYAFLNMGGESEGEHLLGPCLFPPLASCLGQSHRLHLLFMLNLPEGPNYGLVAAHISPLGEPTLILRLKLKAWHVGMGWICPTLGNSKLLWKKGGHIKKVRCIKVIANQNEHTHTSIWAETQPLTTMRANTFTWWTFERWIFSMLQFFILGTTCLCVATEQLYVLWMPCEMTPVRYFLEFPPTIFWGSHAEEVSYSKPIMFLLEFAWVRTELFSCELRDKIHIYLLQKCKIP